MQERVTRDDLRSIPPGKTRAFTLRTAKALVSAKSAACQLARTDPPRGVSRFRTCCDYDNLTITIEAIRK